MSGTLHEHESRIDALECKPAAVTVLYLGVSPEDAVRLRTDEEARDIREAIRLSDNPDSIAFEDRWAMRQNDLLQALNEVNPEKVHFSGHGAEDGSLAIEDSAGKTLLVSKDAMAAVIEAAAERVRLVVFNACFSDEQAEKILEHVDAVIGMSDSISDKAALAFARQLYSSIGFGHSPCAGFQASPCCNRSSLSRRDQHPSAARQVQFDSGRNSLRRLTQEVRGGARVLTQGPTQMFAMPASWLSTARTDALEAARRTSWS